MTWEENNARQQGPWNGRTLCRGLEIGSYALAKGRRWNVEQGKLFDTACFVSSQQLVLSLPVFWSRRRLRKAVPFLRPMNCFLLRLQEWIDAYEEKTTSFCISLTADGGGAPPKPF